jgi:cytochrome c oxidase cbb3-type subunit I/II
MVKTDNTLKLVNLFLTDLSYGVLERTGPDLHREGGPDTWHFKHMLNPRVTSPGSIMPRYPWLIYNELDRTKTKDKITLLKNVFGAPYTEDQIDNVDKIVMNKLQNCTRNLLW